MATKKKTEKASTDEASTDKTPVKTADTKTAADKAGADKAMSATTANIAETLASVAGQLAQKGSARVLGVGKFSIHATQTRKGLRRRVVLNVEPELQAKIKGGAVPDKAPARALVEALGSGETLRVVGLGSFSITNHPAATSVHPRTRKTVAVPAYRALTFSGATLKK